MKNFKVLFSLLMLSAASTACANPSGADIILGEVSITYPNSKTVQILTGKQAIIHWKTFSIDKEETTRFVMPNKSSSVLNRVTGGDMSHLLGRLQSNGRVFLINPKGILMGESSVINTAAFIGSSFDILNREFLADKNITFEGSTGTITNLGKVVARDGDVVLIGVQVVNEGNIAAPNGSVALVSAQQVLLQTTGEEKILIRKEFKGPPQEVGVENSGSIQALQTELKTFGSAYGCAIKDTGTINALAAAEKGGRIFLIAEKGSVDAGGSLTAAGGEIHVLGSQVVITPEAAINTSHDLGGGVILIGGDYRGKNPSIAQAQYVRIEEGALLTADGLQNGNGGRVIIWSDQQTGFFGKISAQGGAQSGNGGLVEISSLGLITPFGEVTTHAENGATGTLLLDPCAVTVSNQVDSGFVLGSPPSYNFGTSAASNINTTTLEAFLHNNNVVIDASASGTALEGSVIFQDVVNWASPNSLTVTANDSTTSFIQFLSSIAAPRGSLILNGGTVIVGDSSQMLTEPVSIAVDTLTINANAHTTDGLSILASNYPNAAAELQVRTATINVADTLLLQGGSADATYATIQSALGALTFTGGGGNATLLAGDGSGSSAFISASSGGVGITGFTDLSIEASSVGVYSAAFIETKNSGDIDITVDGTVALTGGAVAHADATIVTFGNTGSSAHVYITAGGNVTLNGGVVTPPAPAPSPEAPTETGGQAAILTSSEMGDILINAGGDVALAAGTQPNTLARVEASSGAVTITALGDVSLISTTDPTASNAYTQMLGGVGISIVADQLSLTGGNAPYSYARLVADNGAILLGSLATPLASANFQAGSASAGASDVTISTAFGGDIEIRGGILSFASGSGQQATVNLLSGLDANGGDITLAASNGVSVIGTVANRANIVVGATGAGSILIETASGGNNIELLRTNISTQPSFGTNNQITLNSISGSICLGGTLLQTALGDISLNAGTYTSFVNGSRVDARVPDSGSVTSISGSSTYFDTTTRIDVDGSSPSVIFVVDNDNPTSPSFNSANQLNYPIGAKITLSNGFYKGQVRLYAPSRNLMGGIDAGATINGLVYDPVNPEFTDTAHEVWEVYYPDIPPAPADGSDHFTIYYKQSPPP